MKNLLSENMLRFGTKNLSESMKKSLVIESIMQTINEHGLQSAVRRRLLTEQTSVELMKHSGAKVALKSLKALLQAGTKLPANVVMGQYSLVVQTDVSTDSGQIARGVVGGLHSHTLGGATIPIPSNLGLNEGGKLEFFNEPVGKWTILNFDNTKAAALAGTTAEIAAAINKAFMYYTLADVTAMLAAHPNKTAYATGIAAYKASTSPSKALLTGNAKAFYGV